MAREQVAVTQGGRAHVRELLLASRKGCRHPGHGALEGVHPLAEARRVAPAVIADLFYQRGEPFTAGGSGVEGAIESGEEPPKP